MDAWAIPGEMNMKVFGLGRMISRPNVAGISYVTLETAVNNVGEELGLEDAERPELDHDTKNTPGMTEITKTILTKISHSAVFVADLTPIGKTPEGKALPNPNVLIELGWALKELGDERIIGIVNTAEGWKPDDLPFDIRHRRALPYELSETATKKMRKEVKERLIQDLTGALKTNLGQYVEDQAASEKIEGVAAKHDDPSIWASSDHITHQGAFGGMTSIVLPTCPRGYIRIIPAGWKQGIPAVNTVANLGQNDAVQPKAEGTINGDFSACEQGFARYWLTGNTSDRQDESRNVAMYFDETGEFWVIHGTTIYDWPEVGLALNEKSLLSGWADTLHRAMAFFDNYGANPTRKVEAGLMNVHGVYLPGRFQSESIPARKNSCVVQRQQRNWDDQAQLDFLTDAYNKVLDLFGLPHRDQNDARQFLNR